MISNVLLAILYVLDLHLIFRLMSVTSFSAANCGGAQQFHRSHISDELKYNCMRCIKFMLEGLLEGLLKIYKDFGAQRHPKLFNLTALGPKKCLGHSSNV